MEHFIYSRGLLIHHPSETNFFFFFFFKPNSFEDRVLLDTRSKIASYLVAYCRVQK